MEGSSSIQIQPSGLNNPEIMAENVEETLKVVPPPPSYYEVELPNNNIHQEMPTANLPPNFRHSQPQQQHQFFYATSQQQQLASSLQNSLTRPNQQQEDEENDYLCCCGKVGIQKGAMIVATAGIPINFFTAIVQIFLLQNSSHSKDLANYLFWLLLLATILQFFVIAAQILRSYKLYLPYLIVMCLFILSCMLLAYFYFNDSAYRNSFFAIIIMLFTFFFDLYAYWVIFRAFLFAKGRPDHQRCTWAHLLAALKKI